MGYDGQVVIATSLETKELQKDLKKAKKDLEKYANEEERLLDKKENLKINIEADESKLNSLENKIREMKSQLKTMDVGTEDYTKMNFKIEEMIGKEEIANQKLIRKEILLDRTNQKIRKNAESQEKLNRKILDTEQKLMRLPKNFDNIGNGIKKTTNRLLKMGLAIFSIRSIFGILSKAGNAYMSSNEEMTNKIQANWVGLGAALEPILTGLVNMFRKVVTAILHFMSVLTGTNYIQKANEALLKKQTKETNNLAKATKNMASWDEATVLNDSSNTTTGGSSIDTTQLFDIAELGEGTIKVIERVAKALQPVYDFLKKIVNFAVQHPESILAIIGGVGLLTMLGKVIGVAGAGGAIGTGLAGILGALLAIIAIGTITICVSIIYNEIKKAREENEKLIESTKENKKTTDEIIQTLKEHNDVLNKTEEDTKKYNNSLNSMIETNFAHIDSLQEERDGLGPLSKIVYDLTKRTDSHREVLVNTIDTTYKLIDGQKQQYEQGKLNSDETVKYKENMEKFIKVLDHQANGYDITTTSAKKLAWTMEISEEDAKNLKNEYIKVKDNLEKMGVSADIASGEIDEVAKNVGALATGKTIKINADTTQAKNKIEELKKSINGQVTLAFGAGAAAITNGKGFATGGIIYPNINNLPRLASGGIINQPGRGVPLISAIGGERGAEGVLPLTDSQQMDLLGQAIARHMTINLTNINQMNARTISKEIKRVSAQQDFAMNG